MGRRYIVSFETMVGCGFETTRMAGAWPNVLAITTAEPLFLRKDALYSQAHLATF